MQTAIQVIEELGGATVVAREIGAPLTTVHSWVRKNSIPHWRHLALIDLATRKGKTISIEALRAKAG